MSFLIEDILKKDFTSNTKQLLCNKKRIISEKSQTKCEDFEKAARLNNYSILQQTLLNRINPYYSHANDCYSSERPYSSVYNYCDKTYLPHNYLDFYNGNGHPYLPLYARNRFYSAYESAPMMFQMSSKRKGGQVRFTSSQTDALEKRFNCHKYLSPEDRKILADSLKLSDKQVKTWFQNRRAKWRRSNSTSSNNTDEEYENQAESDSSERGLCDKRLKNCLVFKL